MHYLTFRRASLPQRALALAGLGLVLLAGLAPSSFAASGAPLPRCSATSAQFYLMRYMEATTANTPPRTVLDLATVPASGAVTLNNIWDGQTAPTPSPRDLSPASGATVAGAMGKDGYIYAMRAIGTREPGWDLQGRPWADGLAGRGEWSTHTRYYEMLRYGRDGVDNLGIVEGLGTYRTIATDDSTQVTGATDNRLGPNFNAADIDPVSGIMYLASFQTGGALNRVFRIDVTQTPPRYLSTLTLSANIPGTQSGDFAIDAAGEWAYGIASTSRIVSQAYRFNLTSGVVESLGSSFFSGPWGAGARLSDDTTELAFYGAGTRVMTIPAGTLGSSQATASANSADAAACLPQLVATLQCSPASLVDSAGNVSTCTVTLDQPAPAGGLAVALTPPAANGRYSTTCGSSATVPPGATSATCTITATPNTVPGDGFVDATVQLDTPAATADYGLGTLTSATVRVDNDDVLLPTAQLVCTPPVLTDAPAQVSTCTVSLSAPAPAGGLSIGLTPPAANPRYSSTCASPLAVAAGASSASCTVTATPNTDPGDGSVVASIALLPGTGYTLDSKLAQAQVTVENDDGAAALTPVPTLGVWGLILMSLGLGGLGWRQRRRARG